MQHALNRSIERALLARCEYGVASAALSDIARDIHPEYWEALLPQVQTVLASMVRDGRMRVTRDGAEIDVETDAVQGVVELQLFRDGGG